MEQEGIILPENLSDQVVNSKHKITSKSNEDNASAKLHWTHSIEFLMSCISVSVGLGNIWRFPYSVYENGGGAFLIAYTIMFELVGKPVYFFEMALGQFTSKGSVKALSVIPVMKGVAIGQQIAATCVITYYCSFITLASFYFFESFAAKLPWAYCWQIWKEFNCIESGFTARDHNHSRSVPRISICSTELYYIREVIKQKDDISDGIGNPDQQLIPWLLLAWLSIFLIIVKNVKSSGKFYYFIAIFPYVVILILLGRALTLEGAWDGIKFFITPNLKLLLHPQVWYHATTQMLFSLSVGQGAIIMLSSHNHFDHNIYRDSMIITTLDSITSLIAGIAIFGILGNLAINVGETDIGNVIKSGAIGLVFISYPDAIAKFTYVPQLFSVLFFFMMFVLGVGSAVALQSSIAINVKEFLKVWGWRVKFWHVAGVCCSLGCLIGLVYITPGGQWVLALVDHFGANFVIFALEILQVVGIMWIYGVENFCWDVEFMLKRRVSVFWRVSWFFITPFMLIIIFIYSMINFEHPTYMSKEFPTSCIIVGWILFSFGMIQVFIWPVWMIFRRSDEDKKESAMKYLFKIDPFWGPDSKAIRAEWTLFKSQKLETRQAQAIGHSKYKQIAWVLLRKYD